MVCRLRFHVPRHVQRGSVVARLRLSFVPDPGMSRHAAIRARSVTPSGTVSEPRSKYRSRRGIDAAAACLESGIQRVLESRRVVSRRISGGAKAPELNGSGLSPWLCPVACAVCGTLARVIIPAAAPSDNICRREANLKSPMLIFASRALFNRVDQGARPAAAAQPDWLSMCGAQCFAPECIQASFG